MKTTVTLIDNDDCYQDETHVYRCLFVYSVSVSIVIYNKPMKNNGGELAYLHRKQITFDILFIGSKFHQKQISYNYLHQIL